MAAKTSTVTTYPPSDTGYWEVKLNRVWEDVGFFYRPSDKLTVNEEILKRMIADEVVTNVVAAA